MFWAAFGFGCRSDLVVIEGDQNAKRGGVTAKVYIEVLREYLPTIIEHDSIFMQDNAPYTQGTQGSGLLGRDGDRCDGLASIFA
jgi:hypothetical protein